jgi:predicted Zn-dependent peptidase
MGQVTRSVAEHRRDLSGDRPGDTAVATLPNGVRIVTIRLPQSASASVSVFVRTGSRNESGRLNGISHVVEHMAFKGTHVRDAHRLNLDAERLGAQVNAYTDKDHTAYHMTGLAQHAGQFVQMLGDIVRHSTFPADELERERQVILQEYIEDEDDPVSTAFKLFDKLSFGAHPLAQPVIGTRRNIERFTRDDLLAYVQRQYTGANVIVGVAGDIDPAAIVEQVRAAFGSMERGHANQVAAPSYVGGVGVRRQSGSSQSHVMLGFPVPTLQGDHHAAIVAAALFGEGMSSPLMHEIRERRGLVYYASCNVDVADLWGLFVIDASLMPGNVDEFFAEVGKLLVAHTRSIDRVGLERARNQILVRRLQARERPARQLEDAAQDLFAFGAVRPHAELQARIAGVSARQVREAFERMLAAGPTIAMAGKLPRNAGKALRLS